MSSGLRFGKILFLCALIHVMAPAPAHAFSWFWLDNFSGPGWFLGEELEVRLVCFGPSAPPTTAAASSQGGESHDSKVIAIFTSRCLKSVGDENRRRFSINPFIAYAIASNNSLIYADQGVNRRVELLRYGVNGDFVVP